MREITYHQLFSKKSRPWKRNWRGNKKPALYWLASQNSEIRTLSGLSLLLLGEIKHKDMIQKTDEHYRKISIENNTEPMNARVGRGNPF